MMKCDCCGSETNEVKKYELPQIGYGSIFDNFDEEKPISFKSCPKCQRRMNKYIRKRGIAPYELWSCRIKKIYGRNNIFLYEEFEHENLIWDVLHNFVPKSVEDIDPPIIRSAGIKTKIKDILNKLKHK